MTKPHLHAAETWRNPKTLQRAKVWPQSRCGIVLDVHIDVYEYRRCIGKFLTGFASIEEARDYLTRSGFVRAA
ncbi:MAG: hypothetical protein RL758_184 [Pseudomonadota bacterium]|jgi:hypothetical protein